MIAYVAMMARESEKPATGSKNADNG